MPRSRISAMTLTAALLLPVLAQADGFAAVDCKYLDGGAEMNPFLAALNGNDTPQSLVCDANPDPAPLGLDSPVEGEVNRVLVGNIEVLDNHPTEDVSCFLVTIDRNGDVLQSDSVTSSGTGSLQIGDASVLQVQPNEADARAALVCSVPGLFEGNPSGVTSFFATSDFD